MDAVDRYARFDHEPDSQHNLVVGLVPPGARVLEFGCATGHMSEVLTTRLGCSVTGIELSPEAGRLAVRVQVGEGGLCRDGQE
jgi:2-polyprenyl-3-methyl-5-hydroxy-6-metoxy-1,4-benzoquinol methylase